MLSLRKYFIPLLGAAAVLLLAGCSKFSAEWQQMSHAERHKHRHRATCLWRSNWADICVVYNQNLP